MIKVDVESIRKFLESQDMKAVPIAKTLELPFEQLFIPMGVDDSGRNLLLQIQIIEVDLLETVEVFSLKNNSAKLTNLQFYYSLPFKIIDKCIVEVARMVAELNRTCLLPGFEFSEADRMVSFRSALLAVNEVHEAVFIMALSTVISNIEIFSSAIEDVGSGKITLAALVKAAQEGGTPP